MTTQSTVAHQNDNDQDMHKGAVEGDKPEDKASGNASGTGVDKNGRPNNPLATAQDREGANADKTQG